MLQQIGELIQQHQTFLIAAHERPDGDAIGSTLALYNMLRGMGKDAVVYNQDSTPENFLFLPGSDLITRKLPPVENFEVAAILDCGELERIGKEAAQIAKITQLVNIDHHVANGGFCDVCLLDADASSTGELIFRLARHLEFPLTSEIATCLYTAIVTDTGGFRYGNTRRDALLAAAELVEKGANPQWISENVYESDHPGRIRLLAMVLPTLTLEEEGRVGSLVVTQKALAEAGALPDHAEGFVDFPRSIRGVEISLLYSELVDGRFKISLRSKGKANVERVARFFGGGGHVNAAGFRVSGELSEIRRRVSEAIRDCIFNA
ncbi:MAG: bifunctional oligoribonuclease/PAP phosphatase NrnA [Syntrophales bacterium]|jgi:phosphoesterase RecJ-like protein|nr:bifunctional oligoribonuclease/PAP phosphatase NrnA [Syntrophales bacterium]